ncbi:MAG: MBL fold metallo-hydrolase [Actinomycetales bacterium]|nr:MBL fold metallo-hydrolase [Actinomycetales bacterium]
MLVVGFPAGPWGTNCWVLAPAAGEQCVIVDPGKDAVEGIEDAVREHGLAPVAVLLTHGHIDHVWSVAPVCGARGIPAYLHPADRALLTDPMAGISGQTRDLLATMTDGVLTTGEPDDVRELVDGIELELAGLSFVVDHAPGHTRGSVMFRRAGETGAPPLLLSGDVLFEGSIGRTDLPGGDHAAMLRSLTAKVLPLDDETVVLPGHGGTTTVGRERTTNPYLTALAEHVPAPGAPTKGL